MPKRPVVVAEFDEETKQVKVEFYTEHIPTLAYILVQLQQNVIELLTQAKIKQELKEAPKVIIPGSEKHNILNFVRRKLN